jgi:predicted dehydrogenase
VDDAFVAMVKFENGSVGTFEATRFGIGIKNGKAFQIHGANGMLRFNLERLNHLEFVDATQPSTEQGPRDLLVTDLKHPIFGNFWRPGHIIGYEHTFIAAVASSCSPCRRRTLPARLRRRRRSPTGSGGASALGEVPRVDGRGAAATSFRPFDALRAVPS